MKKILSIDGGGIKGAFPAAFLAELEDSIDGSVGEYFDLIVGTSTGGIIALGLGMGLSATELLSFYKDLGSEIFQNKKSLIPRFLWSPKYNQAPLKRALAEKFEHKLLGHSKTRLLIPSLNLETGEVHLYKTSHHPRLATDYKTKMVDVALATAAAPTFFPTHVLSSGIPLVDGGMWANNPVAVAAVEALTMLDWEKGDFKILSLGCTEQSLDSTSGIKSGWGWLHAKKIIETMMQAQASSAFGMAQHLAGHDQVIRISPHVKRGKYKLDSIKQTESLVGLGVSEARKYRHQVMDFFSSKADAFTPFHQLD